MEQIYINNVTLSNSAQSVYAITGCSAISAGADTIGTTIEKLNARTETNVYVWTQKNGTKASSTGTIYGIYDLSGGTWERVAGLVSNGHEEVTTHGNSLLSADRKYVTVYPNNDSGITDFDMASKENYKVNTKIYGDAIRETSAEGIGKTAWYIDSSYFVSLSAPFFMRSGIFYDNSSAGLFYFFRNSGGSSYDGGFRAVLVTK